MKASIVPWLVWAFVIFVVQGSTMYCLLRVLECRFFISAIVASVLAVTLAHFARRAVERRSAA